VLEIDPILEFQVSVGRHKIPRMRQLGNSREHLIVLGELNTPQNKKTNYT